SVVFSTPSFHSFLHYRYLLSFPTRRSSDLFSLNFIILTVEKFSLNGSFKEKNSESSQFRQKRLFVFKNWNFIFRQCCVDVSTMRSEEHTSELQSRFDLVCRLLLEKKKNTKT